MIVRVATVEDVELAARREPPGADVAVRHFARQERGEAVYLVAREADEILGGELLVVDGEAWGLPDSQRPSLRHLYVDPAHRSRGVGAALMVAAEQEARTRGFSRVSLVVDVNNSRARELYLRLGYEFTGEQETDTYSYVDQDGAERQATETGDVMIKLLRPLRDCSAAH